DVPGNLDHNAVRQVRDVILILNIEMPAIHAAGFQAFDDVAAVFFAAILRADLGRGFLQPVGEIGLEPVPPFRADAQVAAGFAVDPHAHVDPLSDLVGALAIPRDVFAEVSVGFGGVVA